MDNQISRDHPESPDLCLVADDLLRGADQIAAYLGLSRRQAYHVISHKRLPTFRLGTVICARKSSLLRWIEAEEAKSMGDG